MPGGLAYLSGVLACGTNWFHTPPSMHTKQVWTDDDYSALKIIMCLSMLCLMHTFPVNQRAVMKVWLASVWQLPAALMMTNDSHAYTHDWSSKNTHTHPHTHTYAHTHMQMTNTGNHIQLEQYICHCYYSLLDKLNICFSYVCFHYDQTVIDTVFFGYLMVS